MSEMIMLTHWDILVHDRYGRLQLGVEVKTTLETSVEYVTEWKQNIFSHEELADLPYFMMAFPDRFYLWKNPSRFADSTPDYVIDARSLVSPFFKRTGIQMDGVRGSTFEMIVSTWLGQIVHFSRDLADLPAALRESGLLDAIEDGALAFEAVA